jgi:hypothetical protein
MSEIRATVTKEFPGVEDGAVYPRQILVGEEISGSLAETAIGEKWAKETKDSKADRNAADDDAALLAKEKQEADDAAAVLKAKRDENIAKLALLPHAQLVALAAEHQFDIAGLTSEQAVIEAIQSGMEVLKLEIPAPVALEPAAPETKS